jgi:hypothetical protein
MELNVIRHKSSSDYFKGFYPPEQADAYSYHLQRMFESGAAAEGDYFIVHENGKPYLQAEIFRNNTRRIWEKPPLLAPGAVYSRESTLEALRLIFDFLAVEEFYPRPEQKLEIMIQAGSVLCEEMQRTTELYRYEKFQEITEYTLSDPSAAATVISQDLTVKPMTEIDPDERFELVYNNDVTARIFSHISPEKLYQDYLDEGYESEVLWAVFHSNENPAGICMPVFTSGMKNTIKLLNYNIINNERKLETAKAVVSWTAAKAAENKVKRMTFPIDACDGEVRDFLEASGAIVTALYSRWSLK